MAVQTPSLTEILAKLADDWSIAKNRFDRCKRKRHAGDADAGEREAENRDEAFHTHPFPWVLNWVTVQTGISSDDLRKAALEHFERRKKLVGKLGSLDEKGRTSEVWDKLLREYPSVLIQSGLMSDQATGNADSTALLPERGEANEGAGSTTTSKTAKTEEEDPNRYAALGKLQLAFQKAWFSFVYAEAKQETRLEDRQAWDWLTENGIENDDEGILKGYELPTFDTWSRQLRRARKAVGEQKYTPQKDKQPSRSIIPANKHEPQRTGDE